jgi:hypothetical protein
MLSTILGYLFKISCPRKGGVEGRMESQTDWNALEEKTDEEIREAAQSDPDAHFLDEEWFENAVLVSTSPGTPMLPRPSFTTGGGSS